MKDQRAQFYSNIAHRLAMRGPAKLWAFTMPGLYPIVYLDSHNETLCADCATSAMQLDNSKKCRPAASMVHYEGAPIHCADCNLEIESAYGDPDQEDE